MVACFKGGGLWDVVIVDDKVDDKVLFVGVDGMETAKMGTLTFSRRKY